VRIIPKYFARLEQHEKSSCVKGNFISAGHGIETREAESASGPGWCHSHCVAQFGWNGPAPACPAGLPNYWQLQIESTFSQKKMS